VRTKQIFNYYSSNSSLEIIAEVENVGQNCTFTQTDQKPHISDPIFLFFFCFFLAQLSLNGMHRIVGYQMQQGIHLWCLQKSIKLRYLMRQEVKLTLDSDVP